MRRKQDNVSTKGDEELLEKKLGRKGVSDF